MPDTILHVIRYEDPSVGCVHYFRAEFNVNGEEGRLRACARMWL